MSKKIVIIGGVAGGAGAAARLRRLNEEDKIIIFEKDPYISFANCGLPYYVGKKITDRDKLIVQKAEDFARRFRVVVRQNTEVLEIDSKNKTVKVINHITNDNYEESYDKLIISTGARAFFPPITGLDKANNVYPLKNIPDTDNIYNYIKDNNVKNAVVIGGGFIGVEIMENLIERGIDTTLVDQAKSILSFTIDREFANVLQNEIETFGGKFIFNEYVSEIADNGKTVVTSGNNKIKTDLIIMAAGIRPNTSIAEEAGIKLTDKSKHIVVSDKFETNISDIYAVGDATLVKSSLYNDNVPVPLAWPANRHARLVADVINDVKINNKPIFGASIIKVFNYTYASVGLTESKVKELKYDYDIVYAQRGSHAGYYPGAEIINLKVIFEKKTGLILGAMGVGKDGVDKRIDVIATVMSLGGKITDLSSIELCYAPPFNSAKDPVNIIGYIGENVFNGDYKTVQWHEIDEVVSNGGFLLDVRTSAENEAGAIKGSKNIELDTIRDNLTSLPSDKSKPIYVTCQVGHRAYLAIRILKNNGYKNLFNLVGGYSIYKKGKNL